MEKFQKDSRKNEIRDHGKPTKLADRVKSALDRLKGAKLEVTGTVHEVHGLKVFEPHIFRHADLEKPKIADAAIAAARKALDLGPKDPVIIIAQCALDIAKKEPAFVEALATATKATKDQDLPKPLVFDRGSKGDREWTYYFTAEVHRDQHAVLVRPPILGKEIRDDVPNTPPANGPRYDSTRVFPRYTIADNKDVVAFVARK